MNKILCINFYLNLGLVSIDNESCDLVHSNYIEHCFKCHQTWCTRNILTLQRDYYIPDDVVDA